MKSCLYCAEQIQDAASVCHFCGHFQVPHTAERSTTDVADRTIKLVDLMIRWLGIPTAIVIVVATIFGVKEINDLRKAADETAEIASLFKTSRDSFATLLERTVQLQTTTLLTNYPLDSEAEEFRDGVSSLAALIEALEKLNRQTGGTGGARELRLAKALVAYKEHKHLVTLNILSHPYNRGMWEHHIRGAALNRLARYKEAIVETEAAIAIMPSGTFGGRSRKNLAGLEAQIGNLDGAIEGLTKLLKAEDAALGRVNLAALYAKRGKPGDFDKALAELERGFDDGACVSLATLRDPKFELSILATHSKYRAKIEELVAKRGKC